jgi:hypothetical protein
MPLMYMHLNAPERTEGNECFWDVHFSCNYSVISSCDTSLAILADPYASSRGGSNVSQSICTVCGILPLTWHLELIPADATAIRTVQPDQGPRDLHRNAVQGSQRRTARQERSREAAGRGAGRTGVHSGGSKGG